MTTMKSKIGTIESRGKASVFISTFSNGAVSNLVMSLECVYKKLLRLLVSLTNEYYSAISMNLEKGTF